MSNGPKYFDWATVWASCCDQFATILRSRIAMKDDGIIGNIPGLLSILPCEYSPAFVPNMYQFLVLKSAVFSQLRSMVTRQYLNEILNASVVLAIGFGTSCSARTLRRYSC